MFFIKFWLLFYPAGYCYFIQLGKRDKSYLSNIILQTNRFSSSSSAQIARYSSNILLRSSMPNVYKLHMHFQNIMFNSIFNILLVNK